MKLAHDGVQIEKDLRRDRSIHRLVKKTQDGTLGTPTEESKDEAEDVVNVGNEIHYHYQKPDEPAAPQQKSPMIMPQQEKRSAALPLIAGLALGTLIPAAGWVGYMLAKPGAPIAAPEFDDESVSVGLGRIDDYLNENTNEQ